MVQKITWTEQARRDLRRIYDYIAGDSERYAQVQIQNIQTAAESLMRFPLLGRQVPEFPELPYREIIVGSYRVIYRFNESKAVIFVMSVTHGRQLLQKPPL